MRQRLSGLSGRRYWRTLDELAETPEFEEMLHREFPVAASEWHDPVSRRSFLKLMGASLALAGLSGCGQPREEKIVPYVQAPEQLVPGKPLFYASAIPLWGYGHGVLVETHMGRPTKVEGNPDHPASLGATNVWMQASVLTLWDPDRAQVVRRAGQVATWTAFLDAWRQELAPLRQRQGAGLRILTETVTSPTLTWRIQELIKQFPQAKWHHYEPVNRDGARAGSRLAFGRVVNTVYRFDQAKRILSLDANFLLEDPGSLRYARQFIDQRRMWMNVEQRSAPTAEAANRLYMAQSTPAITGAMADHRLVMKASQVESFARAVARELGLPAAGQTSLPAEQVEWIRAMVRDLKAHAGASIVIAGDHQPAIVHALAHAMNATLGNVGKTVVYTEPIEANQDDQVASLMNLVQEMRSGQVDTLMILGGNPVFTAPADADFLGALDKVRLRIHHSLYYDETSFHCHWHIPESHPMEAWSDVRAFEGTASIIQPQIYPLYQSRSVHEVVAALGGQEQPDPLGMVQAYWRQIVGGGNFDAFWQEALQRGVIPNTGAPVVQVNVNQGMLGQAPQAATAEGLEIIFRADPTIWDGRHANNAWLQELPKPLTKLTWDNAALMSPATAVKLGLGTAEHPQEANEKLIRLHYGQRELTMPAWVLPGHPNDAVTVYLGYGRQRSGRVGTATGEGGGFNVYGLRTSQAMGFGGGLSVERSDGQYALACTQPHQLIEGRDLIRSLSIAQFHEQQGKVNIPKTEDERHGVRVPLSLYPEYRYEDHKWAMEIDLNSCIGCNACVIACQAENNVPVVGKREVLNSREMHWLRIDTYFEGPIEEPQAYFEPLPCMHCEKAPCEVVCPVAATTHSAEGLNEMTYNRCVGTRYCSNNCPYKVRRFNFFHYNKTDPPQLMLMKNPDVTVRQRGVMEKCTYCVQRINHTRIELKKLDGQASAATGPEDQHRLKQSADLLMRDLESACAQACPTRAIVFGDLNYKYADGGRSLVAGLREQPHNYGLLTELNTQPRTQYLFRFSNPNPEMPAAARRHDEH